MVRRDFLVGSMFGLAASMSSSLLARASFQDIAGQKPERLIDVEFGSVFGSLPHSWEKCAGSDRTVVGLRDQWRKDLIRARADTGIQSVRCHGLFDDEMGIASQGSRNFNFLYVDQIYDFMLDHGVRPLVELSFMPEAFASSANRIFAYKGNSSPPKNWRDWHDLVYALTDHCVKRYGISEVRSWKFEVWNEPNIAFWSGTQAEYFELYRQAAQAGKEVDTHLQVGGPATAELGWIPDLIEFCVRNNLPLDFVSSHVYPNDPQEVLFGKGKRYPFEQVMQRGLEQVKQQIESSKMPKLPFWLTEWSSQNPAFIVDTIKRCNGLAEAMSYWTFSNVFEEGGVPKSIFNSNFGMIDQWGIARPSLHALALLHKLGKDLLRASDGPVLATRRSDGSSAILVWNLIPTQETSMFANGDPMVAGGGQALTEGVELTLQLSLRGYTGQKNVTISQVNGQVGTALPIWKEMGSPQYPTQDQIQKLREAADLPKPTLRSLPDGNVVPLTIVLPPNGIALLEFAN